MVCKAEEAAWAEDEDRVEVVNPPKEEAAPAHEEEEESREPMPAMKPAVKPAAPKRLEFWAMRADTVTAGTDRIDSVSYKMMTMTTRTRPMRTRSLSTKCRANSA